MPTPPDLKSPPNSEPCEAPATYQNAAFEAVGRFIVRYAETEKGLAFTIDRFVQARFFKSEFTLDGVQILAALFGGVRMERLRSLARELAERAGSADEDVKIIAKASSQLGTISRLRNRIGHYGAHPMGRDGVWCIQTSNKNNIRDHEQREMWRYSIETLELATSDLLSAQFHIAYALNPESREHYPFDEFRYSHTLLRIEPFPISETKRQVAEMMDGLRNVTQ